MVASWGSDLGVIYASSFERELWGFFALIALSAVAARGYDRRERSVARRDGPLAETAMHLGRCVLGGRMEVIASDGSIPNAQQVWSHRRG